MILDGTTLDSKADALGEVGYLVIRRTETAEFKRTWVACLEGEKMIEVNGSSYKTVVAMGVTPAAAINALWENVAGYNIVLRYTRHGKEFNVRWNGLWQTTMERVFPTG